MDLLSSLREGSKTPNTNKNIQIDQQKANAMNLSYLQQLDASVESIVATAGHVALYDFDVSTSQWSRKDVEGSLFLVQRRDGRFRFVILNKKGDSGDYWEDVAEGFSCDKQEPYVMYKTAAGVVGIWFYEEQDCEKFARLFEDISQSRLGGSRQPAPPGPGHAMNGSSGSALLGMLKNRHRDGWPWWCCCYGRWRWCRSGHRFEHTNTSEISLYE
jgi:hypothetical protein